jgi:ATP-binding cassette, subfamily B, bacterial PglK
MRKEILQVSGILSNKDKKSSLRLTVLLLLSACLDAIGIASIMPLMAFLSSPEVFTMSGIGVFIKELFSFNEESTLFLFLIGFVFILFSTSLIVKSYASYKQFSFVQNCEYSIGTRLLNAYLHKPYLWFTQRRGSELGVSILSEVAQISNGTILPMVTIAAQGAIVIAILFLLLTIRPLLAIAVGVILAGGYVLIFNQLKKKLSDMGDKRVEVNKRRFNIIDEVFGGIKDVKSSDLEGYYLEQYKTPAKEYAHLQSTVQVLAFIPRFALEGLAFGGMLLVLGYLVYIDENLTEILPIMTLYAFAGYRLLPALSQIYGSFSHIRYSKDALTRIYNEFSTFKENDFSKHEVLAKSHIEFNQKLELNNISFSYKDSLKKSLDLTLFSINKGERIGIVGSTGSGKSTLTDLILGILKPNSGVVNVDGLDINSGFGKSWRQKIGYVSQHIFLSDDTIEANIAFGFSPRDRNQEAIIKAAKFAHIHEFITSELPEGYQTKVGERGVRLSGGQRQRLGIARALYRNPDVLIFDEATSALDGITEKNILKSLDLLGKNITIIMIAHRLNTVKDCDSIVIMNQGKIEAVGSFDALLKENKKFRNMMYGND